MGKASLNIGIRVKDRGTSLPAHGRCSQTKPEGKTIAEIQTLVLEWLWHSIPMAALGSSCHLPVAQPQPGHGGVAWQRSRPEGGRIIPSSDAMSTPSLRHPHPCRNWGMSAARTRTEPPTHAAQGHDPGNAGSAGLFPSVSPAFCISPKVCTLKSKSTVQIHPRKVFPRISLVEKGI